MLFPKARLVSYWKTLRDLLKKRSEKVAGEMALLEKF